MERDGHRRITGYTPESEWDQTERDWMLALDDYEHSLCPRCGMPVSVCHDELTPTRYTAEAGVCQISLMRDIAAEDWRKQHDGEGGHQDHVTDHRHQGKIRRPPWQAD